MKKNSVLIVAAHPDDDILGCAGYISKYKSASKFKVIFVAEGSTCRFENAKSKDAIEAINNRKRMAIEALALLGVTDVEFNNFPCGRLDQVAQIEINKIIERTIEQFKPDIVITHSKNDLNQDHSIINKSTLIATRPISKDSVKTVLAYEILSSSEWNFGECFRPNLFEEISFEDLKNKQAAMGIYDTELRDFPFPRSFSGIEVLAKYRGMQSGVIYAEAFEILRIVR